ncbi:MAG: uracil-DNA glycosylase [Helicobacteraceae bacterium]|jgi:uracil-DNA glycosylase|nr:uracil-DNA glycosylase [Helicobacteraceae bacterium]
MALEASWFEKIGGEFDQPYMKELKAFLIDEKAQKIIYPKGSEWFRAFELTPFDAVKVVILGQDPYHGEEQAHGLAFSVRKSVAIPPSLINIYSELRDDLGIVTPAHGFLESWAKNGVLLLNATLTVQKDSAGSHQNRGWERFTDQAIATISEEKQHVVFMLWGNYAQKKECLIDRAKHLILTAPHPSPRSAHLGFFGCKHFSKANQYLLEHHITPIDWQIV